MGRKKSSDKDSVARAATLKVTANDLSFVQKLRVWCGEGLLVSHGPLGKDAVSVVARLKRLKSQAERDELCDSLDAWMDATSKVLKIEGEDSSHSINSVKKESALVQTVLSERVPALIGILKRISRCPLQQEFVRAPNATSSKGDEIQSDADTLVANWVADIYGNIACARAGLDMNAFCQAFSSDVVEESGMTCLAKLVKESYVMNMLPQKAIVRKALVLYFAREMKLDCYDPSDKLAHLIAIGKAPQDDEDDDDEEEEEDEEEDKQRRFWANRLAVMSVLFGFGYNLDRIIPTELPPVMFALLIDAVSIVQAQRTRERLGLSERQQSDLEEEHRMIVELEMLQADLEKQERKTEAAVALLAAKVLQ